MSRFTIEGRDYDWDNDTLRVDEAILIKKHTGMGVKAFGLGLMELDPEAVCGMILIAKQRAGEAVRWQDLQHLNLVPIMLSMQSDSEDEDEAAGQEPDPTTA